jgi:hypothetical protein
MKKVLFYLMLLFGEAIIIASFFLFLVDIQPADLFDLNIIIAMFVFTISYIRICDISGTITSFSKRDPGLGVSWYGTIIYSCLAIATIILSIALQWKFSSTLIIDAILLFILFTFYISASISINNTQSVLENIDKTKDTLRLISNQINLLKISISQNPELGNNDIETLKEHLRYVTASTNNTAKGLENKLLLKLQAMTTNAEGGGYTKAAFISDIHLCENLISLRKEQL